jgi:pyruvate/2-oxoglutarate dehydrogenase complex dihydrolipoamide dehydrogenase (E3) component
MSQPERFEVLILGSGESGKLLAWHMARSGRRTAVVERRWIGGSCPNIACLPSKNEIWSARVAHLMHHAAQFGTMTGPVTTDMARFASANETWSAARSRCICTTTRRLAAN